MLFRDNREEFHWVIRDNRLLTFKLCSVPVCVEPPGLLIDCYQQFRKFSFVLATGKVDVEQ